MHELQIVLECQIRSIRSTYTRWKEIKEKDWKKYENVKEEEQNYNFEPFI